MELKKILISGIAGGFVILIISMISSTIFQSLFNYNILTLAGMRSIEDPIMFLFFLQPIVLGIAIAIFYDFTKNSFKGKTIQKGMALGLLGWIVYGIPSAFMVFSSMNYPIGFTINSLIGSLIFLLFAGITICFFDK